MQKDVSLRAHGACVAQACPGIQKIIKATKPRKPHKAYRFIYKILVLITACLASERILSPSSDHGIILAPIILDRYRFDLYLT